jgi:hypothetical protein
MSFQSQRTNGNEDLLMRLRQQAQLMQVDPNITREANENARRVNVKKAGFAQMQQLRNDYQNKGIDVKGEMDDDGNMLWSPKLNYEKRLRAAANDISRAPEATVAMRTEAGNAQKNMVGMINKETGGMADIENGSMADVSAEQERLNQSARRSMNPLTSQGAQNDEVSQGVSAIPSQRSLASFVASSANPLSTPSPSASQAASAAVPAQTSNGTSAASTLRERLGIDKLNPGMSVRTGQTKDVGQSASQSDGFSGSSTPINTQLEYQRGGYADPERELAVNRLQSRMAGVQGDVMRGLGLMENTASERGAKEERDDITSRYNQMNQQTMQPKMQGRVDGGQISQSSQSNQQFNNNLRVSQQDTAASQAAAGEAYKEYRTAGGGIMRTRSGVTTVGGDYGIGELSDDFEQAVARGEIKGAKMTTGLDGKQKIYIPKGVNISRYEANLAGNAVNKATYGTEGTQLQAQGFRAAADAAVLTNAANAKNAQQAGRISDDSRYPKQPTKEEANKRAEELKAGADRLRKTKRR